MISDKVAKAIVEPRTVTATAAVYDLSFHTLMSWLKHGVIKPDRKIQGESKKRLSPREQFLALVVRNITAAGLRLSSAAHFCDFIRPHLELLAVQSVPESAAHREFLEQSLTDLMKNTFLLAEPTKEAQQYLLEKGEIESPLEPMIIAVSVVGSEALQKQILYASVLGCTFTMLNMDELGKEFRQRIRCYAEGTEYKPPKPGDAVKRALSQFQSRIPKESEV